MLDIVQQNNMLGIVLVSQSQNVNSMMKRDCLNACSASFIYTDRQYLWFLSFITLSEMFCMLFFAAGTEALNSLQPGDLENTTKDLFSKTKNKQLQKNSKKRTQTKDILTGWQEPDPAGSETLNQKNPE